MRDLPEGWVETEFGILPKAWEPVEAQQFCKKVADGTHDSPKQQETGKLLITSKNIKDSRLDIASAYHISTNDFDEVNKRSKVDQWDVLLSMIGTVGEVCLIDEEPDFAIKNVGLFKCGGETKGKWLYYFLKSKSGQHYIYSRLSGTTQKYITLGELRKFPIPNPPLPEQKAIADMLSSLDDKIELLREQNKTLETLAQTIFKEWFVHFNFPDPHGKPYRNNGGATVESELGEIPKGWRAGKLREFIKSSIGGDYGKEKSIDGFSEETLCIRGTDLPDMQVGIPEKAPVRYLKKIKLEKCKVISGDVIIEVSGGTENQSTGRTIYINEKILNNSSLPITSVNFCRILRPVKTEYGYYIYSLFQHLYSKKILFNWENGTTGIKNLALNALLDDFDLIMPKNDEKILEFSSLVKINFEKIQTNAIQIQTLSKTRDTLLPKLMSGSVRVNV